MKNVIWTNERLRGIILSFVITAIYDVILRYMAEGKIQFLGIEKMKWVTVLEEYFKSHTVLSAALLAGVVGSIAYIFSIYTLEYFKSIGYDSNVIGFITVFLVSGIVGLGMRFSSLYPKLDKYYYERLHPLYSFTADSMSGIIVMATLIVISKNPALKAIFYN